MRLSCRRGATTDLIERQFSMTRIQTQTHFNSALIPAYLEDTYHWAYVEPRNIRLLDREPVVATILFGNNGRLRRAHLSRISQGQSVLQLAHVYGRLIPDMARKIGPHGQLDVVDIVPDQIEQARRKLRGQSQATVRIGDAAEIGPVRYDTVSCFFLLHEVPDDKKHAVVRAALTQVKPGGQALFVDYHRPAPWHPMRGFYRQLFLKLEPFALSMWDQEIEELSTNASDFTWEKRTFFGGVFQQVIARRRND